MSKILQKNVAEIIVLTIFTIVIMSSCSTTYGCYASPNAVDGGLSAKISR
jgi:hypothetical protein